MAHCQNSKNITGRACNGHEKSQTPETEGTVPLFQMSGHLELRWLYTFYSTNPLHGTTTSMRFFLAGSHLLFKKIVYQRLPRNLKARFSTTSLRQWGHFILISPDVILTLSSIRRSQIGHLTINFSSAIYNPLL